MVSASVIHVINPLVIYWPWRNGRLSWPGWLTQSRHFTHDVITCQPQIRESPPAKDRRPNHWVTPLTLVLTNLSFPCSILQSLVSYHCGALRCLVVPLRTAHCLWQNSRKQMKLFNTFTCRRISWIYGHQKSTRQREEKLITKKVHWDNFIYSKYKNLNDDNVPRK